MSSTSIINTETAARPLATFKGVTRVVMLASITFGFTVAMVNAGSDPELAAAVFKGTAAIFLTGLLAMSLYVLSQAMKASKKPVPAPAGPVALSAASASDDANTSVVSLRGYRDSGFLGASEASTPAYEKVAA